MLDAAFVLMISDTCLESWGDISGHRPFKQVDLRLSALPPFVK